MAIPTPSQPQPSSPSPSPSPPPPPPPPLLQTIDGEIAFFRSIMRARPVGLHRHFHVLAIRNAIRKDTGQTVAPDDIWAKLRASYDLDALEGLETDGYDSFPTPTPTPTSTSTTNPTHPSARSPSPSQNLATHPFFRAEFALPFDDAFDALIAARRLRTSPSLPPSLPASPTPPTPSPRTRTPAPNSASASTAAHPRARPPKRAARGRSKLDLAGLVGGDSDSSALTQDSADEGGPAPVSASDAGGTEYAEEEDVEMREASPAPSVSSRPTRGKAVKAAKRSAAVAGRTRAAVGGATRGSKKKKK